MEMFVKNVENQAKIMLLISVRIVINTHVMKEESLILQISEYVKVAKNINHIVG
jgi:hypothetical protein